jgi:multiple sugar transport system permease protein
LGTDASLFASSRPRPDPPLLARMVGAKSRVQAHKALWGYLFALPWLLGLLVFFGGPILASAYLSLTEYAVLDTPTYIGLQNYTRAFSQDDLFWPSLGRTFIFTVLFVPTSIVGSLALAVLLNQKLRGTALFRTLFYIPHLIPAVALTVLWMSILQPRFGPVNMMLRLFGVDDPPGWLATQDSALYAVTLINVWAAVGGNTMLIFLAGLQGIPNEYYEAAAIDGASSWAKFRQITLPMLTPTIFFNLVLAIIAALKVFTTAWVATQGGPSYATWFFVLHIYNEAFQNFRMGYGSALAWILAVVLILFTLMQVYSSRRWVYYDGH